MCVNTYSLVGEYALDMHHIFSQHCILGDDVPILDLRLREPGGSFFLFIKRQNEN